MIIKSTVLGAAVIMGALAAGSASAGLLGTQVDVAYDFPLLGTQYADLGTTTVDGSVEYPNFQGQLSLNVDDNSLTLTQLSAVPYTKAPFNGLVMNVLSNVELAAVSLDPASTYSLGTFGILANGKQLYLNLEALNIPQGDTVVLDVTTVVPEPAAWVMMLAGFGGVGVALRSGRKVQPA